MKKLLNHLKEYWLFYFIVIQPIIDVGAYFQTKILGSSFSWIIRIILLLVVTIFVFINSQDRKKLIFLLSPFGIYLMFHVINLYRINSLNLFLDMKYFILVFQMPILTIMLIDYIKYNFDRIELIKKGIIGSFLIIVLVTFLSVLTNSYEFTYGHNEVGIIGWFTGSNTPSMILCALCPWVLYYFSKKKSYLYFIMSLIVFMLLYFNATKACYLTLVATFIVILFITLVSKNKISKVIISIFFIFLSFFLYKYSFTYLNMSMNLNNIEENKTEIDTIINNNKESIEEEGKIEIEEEKLINNMYLNDEEILKILNKSYIYAELIKIHGEEKVIKYMRNNLSAENLADNRLLKNVNAKIKTENNDTITKILGIGYSTFAKPNYDLETDLDAIYYYYGYLGFGLYIVFIMYFVILLILKFFKQPSIIRDGEYVVLCYLIPLLIAGGQYSGAFLRKPNANIYLSLFLLLIYFKCKECIKSENKTKRKKISFLCLHLGYGGIETATINSANTLSNEYDVEVVSFYNLENNQSTLLNNKVKVKYLCNYQPNKEIFLNAVHEHKYLKALKEGIVSLIILIQKKLFIIKEIKISDADAIVSTRYDFSVLLSEYGKNDVIKIAQEHHHHNDNKKYISILKNKYGNIDYLCALTKNLKKDYEMFLEKNNHTKVILLPNILVENDEKISNLDKKNIICVSRLNKMKRINELIEIFSKINNKKNKLYIIGDGEELNNLQILVKNLNIQDRVVFTGYLNHEQQEYHYLNSCLFAMTSVTEGLPMVLLEAMQHGLPCIAYKTESGVSDIIKNNKNGYIINNRNQQKYIEKINVLLREKKELRRLSKDAIDTSKKFNADRILKIWKKILG